MNTGHVPGPWWVDHADDVELRNHVGISAPTHGLLAHVVWKMESDERTPRMEANAHLIAAAPELLEALCEMLGAAEADCMDDKSNVWRSLMLNAEAAIAKAQGIDVGGEAP